MHRLLTVPKEEGDKMNYIPHTEKSSLIRTDGKIYSVICIQYGCLFPLMQDNNQHILQKEISRTLSLSLSSFHFLYGILALQEISF